MGKANMTNCCYYLMYVFTFLYLLCGCAILGVALYLRFNLDARTIFDSLQEYYASSEKPTYEQYPEIANAMGSQFYFYFCYGLMLIGGLVMFVGFIGCCGTIYESSCILCFFSFLLLLLMSLQVTVAAFGWWQLVEVEDNAVKSWVETDMRYLVDNYDVYKTAVDNIQQRLKCCGADSPGNYRSINYPDSCLDSSQSNGLTYNPNFYDEGCSRAMMDFLEERVITGLALLFVVGVFELIGILFACCFCCGIRGQSDYSTA